VMGNSSDSTLYKAARQGDVETVRAALKNGANPNQSADGNMPHGWGPLHVAANYGNEDVCKLLLQRGADINAPDKQGKSPLDIAGKRGMKENLQKLHEEAQANLPSNLSPKSPVRGRSDETRPRMISSTVKPRKKKELTEPPPRLVEIAREPTPPADGTPRSRRGSAADAIKGSDDSGGTARPAPISTPGSARVQEQAGEEEAAEEEEPGDEEAAAEGQSTNRTETERSPGTELGGDSAVSPGTQAGSVDMDSIADDAVQKEFELDAIADGAVDNEFELDAIASAAVLDDDDEKSPSEQHSTQGGMTARTGDSSMVSPTTQGGTVTNSEALSPATAQTGELEEDEEGVHPRDETGGEPDEASPMVEAAPADGDGAAVEPAGGNA